MKYSIKGHALWDMFKSTLWLIPISVVCAGLVWFFGTVVLQLVHENFLTLLRDTYIVVWVLCLVYEVSTVVLGEAVCGQISRRLDVPFNDVVEAIYVHNMRKEKPTAEWDTEWFNKQLSYNRAIYRIAEGMAKALRRD